MQFNGRITRLDFILDNCSSEEEAEEKLAEILDRAALKGVQIYTESLEVREG